MVDQVNGAQASAGTAPQGGLAKLNDAKAEEAKLNKQIQNAFAGCKDDAKCQKEVYDLATQLGTVKNEINRIKQEQSDDAKQAAPKFDIGG